MAAVPGDKAVGNSTRAVSLEPPRCRSDSMEEADSSLRKRPRLDNGERTQNLVRSLSADPTSAASPAVPSPNSALLPQSPGNNLTMPAQLPPEVKVEKPILHRSSSRVTINTKSSNVPVSSGPPPDSQPSTTEDLADSQPLPPQELDTSSQDPSPEGSAMQITVPTPISVHSSPSRSPEIEIAEVEDMDQDPSKTIWPSATEDLVSVFPFPFNNTAEISKGLDQTKRCIRGGDAEAQTIVGLRDWLEKAARQSLQSISTSVNVDRLFWEEFPIKVMDELLNHSTSFGEQLDNWLRQGPQQLGIFHEILTNYALLVLKLVEIDHQALEKLPQDAPVVPSLISPNYMGSFEDILCWEQRPNCPLPPLYPMLNRNYHVDFGVLVESLANVVCDAPNRGISRLSSLASQLLRVNPKPDRAQFVALVRMCGIMNNILHSRYTRHFEEVAAAQEGNAPALLLQRTKAVYDFIQLIDPCYLDFIVKLNQSLTAELNKNILDNLSHCLSVITETNPKVVAHIADEYKIDTSELETSQQATIIKHAWIFHRLHKCITKGRMEIRAQAVGIMQERLVSVYHDHIKANLDGPMSHPLVSYLVNFIREVKIIDYIMGVDSHPQLMSRSANIIGFLLVTSQYKNEDTDTMWGVIMESQDPRAVTTILQMLDSFFRTSDLPPMEYLASKLLGVPVRRFDKDFTDFTHNLLTHLERKYQESSIQPHILMYKVCIRILRDCITARDLAPDRKAHLQGIARRHIEYFVQWHLTDEEKLEIYSPCILDIEAKNEHSGSALRTINYLLYGNLVDDIGLLSSHFDFTRSFVEELADVVSSDPSNLSPEQLDVSCFCDRLDIMHRIISSVPDTLTKELGQIIWNTLYASNDLPREAQDAAWTRLTHLIRVHVKSHQRNPFLDRCMSDFLPKLEPQVFDAHVLTFAIESIKYEIQLDPPPPPQEGEIVTIPSVERLWNILINVPGGKIATGASDALVELYLDNKLIRNAPRSAAEATHVVLVDDCVKRLITAAAKLKSFSDGTMSGEDEPMVIVAPENEMKIEELRFSRSLLFLKEFLQGLRKRPQYGSFALLERNKGEAIELLYECYDGHLTKPRQSLRIGDLDTLSDLRERLLEVSGFSNIQVFCGALGKLDFATNPLQTIRDRKLDKAGLLLVKAAGSIMKSPTFVRRQSLQLVDAEILKHFEELYDLLDLEDKFSKEIHDFLVVFPPQPRVRELVLNIENTDVQIFPPDKPFKILFSISAMFTIMTEQANKNDLNSSFIIHCIKTLGALLTRSDENDAFKANERLVIALKAAKTLTNALRVSTSQSVSGIEVPNPEAFVNRLLTHIQQIRKFPPPQWSDADVAAFLGNCFSCFVYSSILDQAVWAVCKRVVNFATTFHDLLLSENRPLVRKSIADVILSISNTPVETNPATGNSPAAQSLRDVLEDMWLGVVSTLDSVTDSRMNSNSEALFNVALVLLQYLARVSATTLVKLSDHIERWSNVVVGYKPFQFVGKPSLDPVVPGFIKLIYQGVKVCFAEGIAIDLRGFREELVTTFLFPQLSDDSATRRIRPRTPLMNPDTRNLIYQLLAALMRNQMDYWQTLGLLDDLIPRGDYPNPPALWQMFNISDNEDFAYERTWEEDRSRILRTDAGYTGLRNLSNTCYINSLVAQLFMNVSFRDFILQVKVTNSTEQRLLFETQKVFSHMQDSWLKYVDMTDLVESIVNYELEQIDVTIQMDVGEFYALLFHRLESQILSTEDQAKFRVFYGGQLIQQIKSKECSHVSEKLESFNSIQCEIKGKSCLEESLQAYVEGEVMQGDNKYSCTSCNRHVDAVKRSCLKDIPDHLIIQLKRFDFDLNILQRSKVNDEFRFPTSIDMAPFKFDTLNGDGGDETPDMFELVGILIHSGSAETGHYYSYIKQRPVASDIPAPWVEFNDIDVSMWDPSYLADGCFGGWTDSPFPPSMRFQKSWNAYMLFYQRVSDIEASREQYRPIGDLPIAPRLSLHFGNFIALQNELAVRGYLLQDEDHAKFVHHLLRTMRKLGSSDGMCTTEHRIEQKAIWCALEHVEQIIVKTEDQPQFEEILLDLEGIVKSCAQCAWLVLEWNTQRPEALRNILMRNKRERIRQRFSLLLVRALEHLINPRVPRLTDSGAHGLDEREQLFDHQFSNLVKVLRNIWSSLSMNVPAWDDYFGLLIKLAKFGEDEIGVILDEGFLKRCLDLILIDDIKQKKGRPMFQLHQRLLERKRKLPYGQVLELTAILVENVDLNLGLSFDSGSREKTGDAKWTLSYQEDDTMRCKGQQNQNCLVERLVATHWPLDPVKRILSEMLVAEPKWGDGDAMAQALIQGMRIDPACEAKNALEAAVLFCTYSANANHMRILIRESAAFIESIGNSGGREHVHYLQRLLVVQNVACADATTEFFRHNVRVKMMVWAPTLLTYTLDSTVRSHAEDLVENLLFDNVNFVDDGQARHLDVIAKELASACTEKIWSAWLSTNSVPYTSHIEEIVNVTRKCASRFFNQENPDDAIALAKIHEIVDEIVRQAVDMPEDIALHDSETILDSTSESELDDEWLRADL